MKRILIAAVLLAFAGPAMAQNQSRTVGSKPAPNVFDLEARVERLERDAADKERQRIDCESARGYSRRSVGQADPCK